MDSLMCTLAVIDGRRQSDLPSTLPSHVWELGRMCTAAYSGTDDRQQKENMLDLEVEVWGKRN